MYKNWLFSGTAVFFISLVAAVLGTVWNIRDSFDSMVKNESAGTGAVGAGIQYALLSSVLGLVGCTIGIVLVLIGVYKARRR